MKRTKNNKKGFVITGVCVACVSLITMVIFYSAPGNHPRSNCYNITNRIKASLSSLGAGGELYYDAHHETYKGFCSSSFIDDAQENILERCSKESIERITCNDSSQAWCAYSSEIYGQRYDHGVHCVDSTGFSGELLEHNCGQSFSCESE